MAKFVAFSNTLVLNMCQAAVGGKGIHNVIIKHYVKYCPQVKNHLLHFDGFHLLPSGMDLNDPFDVAMQSVMHELLVRHVCYTNTSTCLQAQPHQS